MQKKRRSINMIVYMSLINTVFAAVSTGIATLDNGLVTLENISIGIIAGIGIIILAWGGMELGTCLYQHDTGQMPTAIRKLVAGIIMICIGAIIKLFV